MLSLSYTYDLGYIKGAEDLGEKVIELIDSKINMSN